MTAIREVECDGCGNRENALGREGRQLPAGWRSLNIGRPGGGSWHRDVCSPRCAARAVDSTYEDEDRQTAERHGLRAL